MDNISNKDSKSVQSVARTLDLIEILAAHPQGMLLSNLSEQAKLHKSTVYRLLSVLSSRGYVFKDPQFRSYRLTAKLFQLGRRSLEAFDIVSVTRSYLEELAKQTRTSAYLFIQDGAEIVCINRVDFDSGVPGAVVCQIGGRLPMYCTAAGKAMLATFSDAQVDDIWSQSIIRSRMPKTITRLSRMQTELEGIRERGYAINNEETEPGVACVATAIVNRDGRLIGAISVSTSPADMTDERFGIFGQYLQQARIELNTILFNA